jgi:hypothetical protein
MKKEMQILVNKTPSFTEVWYEGFVEFEDKKHYFWLIYPQGKDEKGESYETELRWFFSSVPREVRAMYPKIIESFKSKL